MSPINARSRKPACALTSMLSSSARASADRALAFGAAAAPAEPGRSVRERRRRSRYRAQGRHDAGASVARAHAHCLCPQRRVRARGRHVSSLSPRAVGERPRFYGSLGAARNRWFADSPLEGTGFELLVRGRGEAGCRAFDAPNYLGRVGSRRSDPATAIGAPESRYQSRFPSRPINI